MVTKDQTDGRMRTHITAIKEDLMTGVSFMIPFVTIGGIFLALGFMIGDTRQVFEQTGTLGWYFAQIGSLGLTIMIPVLGGYIAYAIADKPGLAPGFILAYAIQHRPPRRADCSC